MAHSFSKVPTEELAHATASIWSASVGPPPAGEKGLRVSVLGFRVCLGRGQWQRFIGNKVETPRCYLAHGRDVLM